MTDIQNPAAARHRRQKHSPSQVEHMVQRALLLRETGLSHHEIADRLGISIATLYRWKGQCGTLRQQSLERLAAENVELRRRLAAMEQRLCLLGHGQPPGAESADALPASS